jgi:hypothetical protein
MNLEFGIWNLEFGIWNLKYMHMKTIVIRSLAISLVIMIASFFNLAKAQVDTTQVAKPDTVVQEKAKEEKKGKKEDKKRKDEFIPYVGVNFNNLMVSDEIYESQMGVGYHIGFDYKRGKFFYWQVGARFNGARYSLKPFEVDSLDFTGVPVYDIDIPVTGGINFLSAINRIVALRLFVSAVPAFTLGVGDNDLGITKDDINSFVLYGQAGLGVNVAFLVIEVGYNYGFQDMLKNYESKPGQLFINLGFRF